MCKPQTAAETAGQEILRLIQEIPDSNKDLRERIQRAVGDLELHKSYGLRFERHLPEVIDNDGEQIGLTTPYYPYLEHVDSVAGENPKGPEHILLEADNYVALKYLQYTHEGKVDVIYIDPPYNTGAKDWKYNDKFVGDDDEFRHSKWLSFMEKRLKLAKTLLKPTGIIISAINDTEHHTLRMLMEDIFGSNNYITNLVWQGGASALSNFTRGGLDYMIVFAKKKEEHKTRFGRWKCPKKGIQPILAVAQNYWEKSGQDPKEASNLLKAWFKNLEDADPSKQHQLFCNLDQNGKVFETGDLSANNGKFYEIYHPITGKPCKNPNRGWGVSKEKMEELITNKEICFGVDHYSTPRKKRFLENHEEELPNPYIYKDRAGATKSLESLFGKKVFPFPKDVNILKNWINTVGQKNAIVLDFFAGSGTTFQAVAELNESDGGTRQCILVTNNESNICREVTWERVKRVTTGTHAYPECTKKYNGNPSAHVAFYKVAILPEEKIERTVRGWKKTIEPYLPLISTKLNVPFNWKPIKDVKLGFISKDVAVIPDAAYLEWKWEGIKSHKIAHICIIGDDIEDYEGIQKALKKETTATKFTFLPKQYLEYFDGFHAKGAI